MLRFDRLYRRKQIHGLAANFRDLTVLALNFIVIGQPAKSTSHLNRQRHRYVIADATSLSDQGTTQLAHRVKF